MITLSAVVHTYNEAHNIQACIESLHFADEIVVVDNESTDNTVALAKAAGARIEHFKGYHGYPEPARVYGLTCLTGEWVVILDADERVTPELADEIKNSIGQDDSTAGYLVPIKNYHFGRWLKHGNLYPDRHLRLFKRQLGGYPEVGLHRGIVVNGPVKELMQPIEHYSYRDIAHYFQKLNTYTTVEAKRLLDNHHRPTGYDMLIKPWHRFFKAYFFQGGFKDGLPGWLYHSFSAFYVLVTELKVWEHYQQQGESLPVLTTLLTRKKKRRSSHGAP